MTAWKLRIATLCIGVLQAGVAAAQQPEACPYGGPERGDIGIEALRCVGPAAACAINLSEEGAWLHRFSVEPIIDALSTSNPNADALRVGDRIVSVDGRLVTTWEGGRYLANLPVDRDIEVIVRREGRLVRATVHTVAGCGPESLTVTVREETGGQTAGG